MNQPFPPQRACEATVALPAVLSRRMPPATGQHQQQPGLPRAQFLPSNLEYLEVPFQCLWDHSFSFRMLVATQEFLESRTTRNGIQTP